VSARRTEALVWAAVLAVAAASAMLGSAGSIDAPTFLHASRTLLSGRWLHTFADPGLQAGPLQIAGIGAAGRLGSAFGLSPLRGVAVCQALVLTALVLAGASAVTPPRRRPLVAGAIGLAAIAAGVIGGASFYGHPAEVAAPVLWVLAARAAYERRPGLAGALIGLSAGFETWGVLGVPVLLLEPRLRGTARGLGVAAAVVAVVYGPFVFFGSFAMNDYRWPVAQGTLPALVLGPGAHFGWWLRLVQAAVAVAGGVAAAVVLRRRAVAWWVVPLSILWARIALDPQRGAWYLLAPETVALLAVGRLAGLLGLRGANRAPFLKPPLRAADS
jgi:hypothetical protein